MSSSTTPDPGSTKAKSTQVPVTTQWSVLAADALGNLSMVTKQDGSVTGTLFGDPVAGFWDEDRQTLTILRVGDSGDIVDLGLYRGHQFSVNTQWGKFQAMAGIFESFEGPRLSNDTYHSGWFAIHREIGGNTAGSAEEHLWTTIRQQLPDPEDISATSDGELLVIVANGHVAPMAIQNMPHQPPGGPVWAAMFKQLDNVHSHGAVELTKGGQRGTIALVRPLEHPLTDITDRQVYRGGKLKGYLGTTSDTRRIVGWAGTFTALAGGGGRPDRTEYGWFAVATVHST